MTQEDMVQASAESFHTGDTTRFARFIRDHLYPRLQAAPAHGKANAW
jgi:hypothetical protein